MPSADSGQMTALYEELSWRGLVYDATEGVQEAFAKERVTAYIGFDPTASSLHVGNLLVLMALARLQRCGHSPIAIAGGGTGLIGDPSGKSQERSLLSLEQIEQNLAAIKPQLARFLDFDAAPNPARLVNNADWLGQIDLLGFLRDTGKYFTVNYLLQKESVNRRFESDEGISYAEFSYLLLQARDFLELFDRFGCTLQMGGSDQWGNITAGIDLIRKVRAKKAHGLVIPLVTTASGVKFGKTEAGAVWLDPARTPPFAFYQFWLKVDDRDVLNYLKYFTFLDRDTIAALEQAHVAAPEKREAARVLAREVTTLVHGAEEAGKAERGAATLFSGDLSSMSAAEILSVLGDVPCTTVSARELEQHPLPKWLATTGLASSSSEATRLIRGGGIYVNNERVTDEKKRLGRVDAIGREIIVLGKGQRQKHVLRVSPE
jgi:tyrosyl-tRNA synthetase